MMLLVLALFDQACLGNQLPDYFTYEISLFNA